MISIKRKGIEFLFPSLGRMGIRGVRGYRNNLSAMDHGDNLLNISQGAKLFFGVLVRLEGKIGLF